VGRDAKLPAAATGLIGATVAGALAVLAWRLPAALGWGAEDTLAFMVVGILICLAEQFPIPVRFGTASEDVLITDIVFAAALMLAPPAVLALAAAAGLAAGQVRQRKEAHKVAFNVGHELLGLTLAQVLFAVTSGSLPAPVAAAVGMAGYLLVNEVWVAAIVSIVERVPFVSIVGRPVSLSLMQWSGNLAIGIIGAVVWREIPQLTPLLLVPLGLTYLAYHGWFESGRERDRMRSLYSASTALSGPLSRTPELGSFFDLTREILGASAVELVSVENGLMTVQDGTSVETVATVHGPAEDAGLLVRLRPGMASYSAPVSTTSGGHHVLAVYREEELTAPERSLVDALSAQLGVRLQNCWLYSKTLDQRRELNEIFVNSSDGIFVVNPEGVVLSWNPAMERITGSATIDAVGRTWGAVFGPDAGCPTEDGDLHLEREGVPRWIRYTSNAIQGGEEHAGARVVVARDVTAEVEIEQAKTNFVAAISHELRTPLTPLKGLLMMMAEEQIDPSSEERQEYFAIMVNQTTKLERLISDLLDVTTVDRGGLVVRSSAVDVLGLLTEQVDVFRAQAPGRDLSLVGPVPGPVVLADPFRLGQVISNLLSNALKYSPADGTVAVSVSCEGDRAVVSVRDDGEGIPASEQARIFERFHRVDNGSTRAVGGTGLGLYIAKQLTEAMDGKLWVCSEPGGGSTFSVSLPIASGDARERVIVVDEAILSR
jgi:signal transduction histidine kinase